MRISIGSLNNDRPLRLYIIQSLKDDIFVYQDDLDRLGKSDTLLPGVGVLLSNEW